VVDLSTNSEIRHTIEEWQPPRPSSYTGFVFFTSVILVAMIAARHRAQLGWPRLLGLAIFALMGIMAVRGIIWWALAAPVLLSDVLPGRRVRHDPSRVLNVALAAVLVVVGVTYLPWLRPAFASTSNSGTVTDGLLAYAPAPYSTILSRRVPPGARVFAPEIWASWFEFAVPRDRVMIDPRIEVFPGQVWDDYDRISSAQPGWQRTLDRWNIDVLALSTVQQARLISAIGRDPEWTPIYRDGDGVMLVRDGSAGMTL
jgi:hypothetical protein